MFKKFTFLLIVISFSLLQITTKAQFSKDAYVRIGDDWDKYSNTINHGKETFFELRLMNKNSYDRRIFIELDSLPSKPVDQALLKLYMYANGGTGSNSFGNRTIVVRKVTSAWNELTVTAANMPSYGNKNYDSISTGNCTLGWYSWNITQLVNEWIASPSSNFGLVMYVSSPGNNWNASLFYSSDCSNPNMRPKLELTTDTVLNVLQLAPASAISIKATPSMICSGDTAILNVGAVSSTYKWDSEETTSTIKVNPSVTTTYKCTITNSQTTVIDSVIVRVNALPTKPTITLKGDSLISVSATSYKWFNNKGVINGITIKAYKPTSTDDYIVEISDTNGCKIKSDKYPFIWVGQNENNLSNNIYLFPNPASNYIIISENLKFESYKIYDITGKEVISGRNNDINVSYLDKGLYYVNIITKDNITYITKLIKN